MSLCSYELKVLTRIVRGETQPWGAAVGQALESLRGSGYLTAQYRPTPKGRQAVASTTLPSDGGSVDQFLEDLCGKETK